MKIPQTGFPARDFPWKSPKPGPQLMGPPGSLWCPHGPPLGPPWAPWGPRGPKHPALAGCLESYSLASILPYAEVCTMSWNSSWGGQGNQDGQQGGWQNQGGNQQKQQWNNQSWSPGWLHLTLGMGGWEGIAYMATWVRPAWPHGKDLHGHTIETCMAKE